MLYVWHGFEIGSTWSSMSLRTPGHLRGNQTVALKGIFKLEKQSIIFEKISNKLRSLR